MTNVVIESVLDLFSRTEHKQLPCSADSASCATNSEKQELSCLFVWLFAYQSVRRFSTVHRICCFIYPSAFQLLGFSAYEIQPSVLQRRILARQIAFDELLLFRFAIKTNLFSLLSHFRQSNVIVSSPAYICRHSRAALTAKEQEQLSPFALPGTALDQYINGYHLCYINV